MVDLAEAVQHRERYRHVGGPGSSAHPAHIAHFGSVKPNALGGDFHDLLGKRPDIEGARSPHLVLCLFKQCCCPKSGTRRGRNPRPRVWSDNTYSGEEDARVS
jgi:hypothetical protein